MTTTLITGANKGLGFETARRLLAAGHTVYVGSRDAERGHRAAQQLGARAVQLDVTDDSSVDAAAKTIEAGGGLDVLINNAGIETRLADNSVPGAAEVTADTMRTVFETNVFGVVRVTHAFLPLLQRSAAAVIVNVSSGLASITRVANPGTPAYAYPGVAYPASKAAVNMITVQYAKAFPGMRINAVEPGFTATDLNGHAGTQTVEEGADPALIREDWVQAAVDDMRQLAPDGRVVLVRNYGRRLIDPVPFEPLGEPSRFLTCQWTLIQRAFSAAGLFAEIPAGGAVHVGGDVPLVPVAGRESAGRLEHQDGAAR